MIQLSWTKKNYGRHIQNVVVLSGVRDRIGAGRIGGHILFLVPTKHTQFYCDYVIQSAVPNEILGSVT